MDGSRTRRDSTKKARREIVVVKGDDRYDMFLSGRPFTGRIAEQSLRELLWARFGFWGDESETIMEDINENGRKTILL